MMLTALIDKDFDMSDNVANAPRYLKDFLTHMLTIKNKSPKTVEEYFISLRIFFRFMKFNRKLVDKKIEFNDISIDDLDYDFVKTISSNDIYDFLFFCADTLHNKEAARARKLSALRSYFKFLTVRLNIMDTNPAKDIESPVVKKRLPKYLSLDESLQLLSSIDGKNAIRNYAIITLFLNCGMRVSELAGISLGDINFSSQTIRIVGKGNKERIVYLNDASVAAIKDYLKIRPIIQNNDANALFIGRNNTRLCVSSIQKMVKTYLEKAGLKERNLSVHKLRHTAATLMYQHGNVDVLALQEILGHEQLSTTQIYTHLDDKRLKSAVDSNPLSNVKRNKNS